MGGTVMGTTAEVDYSNVVSIKLSVSPILTIET